MNILSQDGKFEYIYFANGLKDLDSTPNSCGGYVYLFNTTNPFNQSINNSNFDNYLKMFYSKSIGIMTIDYVMINIYHNTFVYVIIKLGRSTVGMITYTEDIIRIPINTYQHIQDFNRFFFEIVYLVFFIYYGYI